MCQGQSAGMPEFSLNSQNPYLLKLASMTFLGYKIYVNNYNGLTHSLLILTQFTLFPN